jgi:hypothetical protein
MSDVNSNAPLLGEDGAPAKPSLLGTEALSAQQARLDERIRTLSLVICATAVVAAAIFYLQDILVRLVLALALKYLLSPLIDVINVEVTIRGLRCRIPRGLAIILAMCVAVGGLVIIGVLVTRSVVSFSAQPAPNRGSAAQSTAHAVARRGPNVAQPRTCPSTALGSTSYSALHSTRPAPSSRPWAAAGSSSTCATRRR